MNHGSKRTIRDYWCKPLLKFLCNDLGYKLAYLGLPAPEAHDVLDWIDYINYVIAFQCRNYPESSSVEQARDEVLKLENVLLELERQRKIQSFALYDGYIEEVLIKGKDTVGKEFLQDRIITIYNLDFCNSITVPISYYDEQNNPKEAYKSEAIKKLLEKQSDISNEKNKAKFIMFLTVKCDFFPKEEERFIRYQQDAEFISYAKKVAKLNRLERNLRMLKSYIYQMLKNFFCSSGFTPEFLPAIYYQGIGSREHENWLVHFTIIGIHNKNPLAIAPCLQTTGTFLNQKFLDINNNRFCSRNTPDIKEVNAYNNSVDAFNNSRIFRELWRL